jgi:hypothetical protein
MKVRCAIDHPLIKHRRMDALVIGIQGDEVERLELVNCPHCATTLARPCADARHIEATHSDGYPLCGVPAEGALLVESAKDSDCPLCHEIAASVH